MKCPQGNHKFGQDATTFVIVLLGQDLLHSHTHIRTYKMITTTARSRMTVGNANAANCAHPAHPSSPASPSSSSSPAAITHLVAAASREQSFCLILFLTSDCASATLHLGPSSSPFQHTCVCVSHWHFYVHMYVHFR